MPRLAALSMLTVLLTTACATPDVLEQPVTAPHMAARTKAPLPVVVTADASAPVEQAAAAPVVSAPALSSGAALDWDSVLAAPDASLGQQVTRTASGWSGPKGVAASQLGELTFFADGSWMRRTGESYQHSDGRLTVKRGDTFFHSDGTWSRRVGDAVTRSDGRGCTIVDATMVCR